MEENYQAYLNRVARLTLPETHETQLQNIQESPKYRLHQSGERKPVPFPGYTVITPTRPEDSANEPFYKFCQDYQQQLVDQLHSDLIVPVSPESFHLTLADLIWESAFLARSRDADFESNLRGKIGEIFTEHQQKNPPDKPLAWQPMGFFLRPRALGICLVPKDEVTYERLLELRRSIYQNPDLIALGIEQHYHFTAHVTLAYFGDISEATKNDRQRLYHLLTDLGNQWLEIDIPELTVSQGELRKFDDMTNYYRSPDWPVIRFS